ncbi:AMP-binding protein [bacterium]|nr:AMP-binding protein [bacterium]
MNVARMCAASAKAFPEKKAIVHRDVTLDFASLDKLVTRCASGFHKMGIGPGAKVVLLLEKTPELVISFVACARVGAMVVPINYQLQPATVEEIILNHGVDAIVASCRFERLLSKMPKNHKAMSNLVLCRADEEHRAEDWLTWEKFLDDAPDDFTPADVDDDAPFYLNFTSGTTGAPRAAITTHTNLFWNTLASVETLGLRHSDVHLCMFPAYLHPHEIFYRGIYLGGTSVVDNSLFPKSVARAISDNGVTCVMGAATLYERLLPFASTKGLHYETLRIAESGGMITRETLIKQFEAAFGIPITPVWGSTETAGIAVATPAEEARRGGSIGKTALHYEIKVVREDGSAAAEMEIGEMLISGKGVVSEYHHIADGQKSPFENGWFRTGDLIKQDEDGFIYYVDRKDSMMKVAGMKVFPATIERVLKEHPDIADVCVIPASDKLRGQMPMAVVVTRPGASLAADDLRGYCASRLAPYEVPKLFEFREAMPRTAGGKVLRAELLELYRKDSSHADIADLRAQIDRIDVQIVKLLNERARSLLNIHDLIEARGERSFSPMRDEEVIQNVLGYNAGPAHDGTIEEIFRSILAALKKM